MIASILSRLLNGRNSKKDNSKQKQSTSNATNTNKKPSLCVDQLDQISANLHMLLPLIRELTPSDAEEEQTIDTLAKKFNARILWLAWKTGGEPLKEELTTLDNLIKQQNENCVQHRLARKEDLQEQKKALEEVENKEKLEELMLINESYLPEQASIAVTGKLSQLYGDILSESENLNKENKQILKKALDALQESFTTHKQVTLVALAEQDQMKDSNERVISALKKSLRKALNAIPITQRFHPLHRELNDHLDKVEALKPTETSLVQLISGKFPGFINNIYTQAIYILTERVGNISPSSLSDQQAYKKLQQELEEAQCSVQNDSYPSATQFSTWDSTCCSLEPFFRGSLTAGRRTPPPSPSAATTQLQSPSPGMQ